MELKIVDFETANLLYDVGFPQTTEECYINGTYYPNFYTQWFRMKGNNHEVVSAPNQEIARKFLRDKHEIHIQVEVQIDVDRDLRGYSGMLIIMDNGKLHMTKEIVAPVNASYEQALEEGIKQACKYLKGQSQ